MVKGTCIADGCERDDRLTRGMCGKHYARFRRHGSADDPRAVSTRFWAKVRKTDSCWEWAGYCDRKGYGKFFWSEFNEQYAHRVSYRLANGSIPVGMFVDHICHNPKCVNPSHLRLATNKQNVENHSGATSLSKSGVRGVHWRKDCRKWQGMVRHEGVLHHVGLFVEIEEAAEAVARKRNELHTFNDADRSSVS